MPKRGGSQPVESASGCDWRKCAAGVRSGPIVGSCVRARAAGGIAWSACCSLGSVGRTRSRVAQSAPPRQRS
eukprot:3009684-Pleurochrysis_carterae.AAC.9